jgi:hypothetical protein
MSGYFPFPAESVVYRNVESVTQTAARWMCKRQRRRNRMRDNSGLASKEGEGGKVYLGPKFFYG